jgi:two-component system CheB/CheR fusion protein
MTIPKPSALDPAADPAPAAEVALPATGPSRPLPKASVVVAIGASAGGLAALEQMLPRIPPGVDLAWVYAQHLDPALQTQLVPVLQHLTPMPVREAVDGLWLQPGQLVTIPADAVLTVVGGRCRVQPLPAAHGRRQTLDLLFDSLARDLGTRAVGVLLSGVGSDGCAGLGAIRAAGGLTLAQLPQTAQFDAMPRNALGMGVVDIAAPPAELPTRLLQALAARASGVAPTVADAASPGSAAGACGAAAAPVAERDDEDALAPRMHLMTILHRLRERGQHDFMLYKPSTLLRRIRRRMDVHRIGSMPEYARMLEVNDAEPQLLAQELLIGVTSFFRDPPLWQWLREEGLPRLLRQREDGWRLRAWVAGCSTGEEAYTLAITFREVLDALPERRRCTLQVFATDLSAGAIERARRGVYPASAREDLTPARQARFFVPHGPGLKIHPEIREMVVFATHDLNRDPPFTRLDLLSCRNLLIYLTAPLQRRLLPLFHYSLRTGGLLLLGSSETIGRYEDLFEPMDARLRIYRRGEGGQALPVPGFSWRPPAAAAQPAKESPMPDDAPQSTLANLQAVADRWLMQRLAPPLVLVNGSGDIVYVSGRTGRYLEPAAGQANWNVHVMARAGLCVALSDALERARAGHAVVEVDDLPLESASGPPAVGLRIEPLDEPAELQGLWLIAFRDLSARPRRRRAGSPPAGAAVEAELGRAREEAQSLREEMRASQEELQAANEELQSTNEELQSTNEELTSSKDEMQAMNDELQEVNAELKTKLADLAQAQADVRNLLLGVDVVMLLVDRELRLRRYSEAARQQFGLSDASLGLPLATLGESIGLNDIAERVQDMLRTLVVTRHAFSGRDGRTTSIRMMPYRSLDNVIDGAVIAFS